MAEGDRNTQTVVWDEVGSGWLGWWATDDGRTGRRSQFKVYPTAGLHTEWKWSNGYCKGKCPDAGMARYLAERTFMAASCGLKSSVAPPDGWSWTVEEDRWSEDDYHHCDECGRQDSETINGSEFCFECAKR